MEEGDDDLNGFEEEEYDEDGQIKKPGKKKKELSDFEKMKIKQTIEEMKKNQIQPQKIIGKKISINPALFPILQKQSTKISKSEKNSL